MKKLLFTVLPFISSLCFGQLPSYVPTDSLKAWFPFNGNANDESGHTNHGTVMGASLTTDRNGIANKAYSFNGTSNYITGTIDSFTNTISTSVSAWINYTGDLGARPFDTYFQYGVSGSHTFGYAYNYPSTNLNLYSFCHTNPFHTVDLNDTWHHVVVVDSFQRTKIFVDGALIHSWTSGTTSSCYRGSPVFFIGASLGDMQYVLGKLDDIGVWSRPLSDCEVYRLYSGYSSAITSQPTNDTTTGSGIATFTISDTGGSATYQWQENDGTGFVNLPGTAPYTGTTTRTLTINPVSSSMTGNLYRCIRTGSACNDSSDNAALFVDATGVVRFDISGRINIAPNPADNKIMISSPINIERIDVLNLVGQTAMQKIVNSSNVELDLSNLTAGSYLIRINGLYTKRITKQ